MGVGWVVQENALVELDVVVALVDVVLTEVRLALDVIVDEADVVKLASVVIETEDVTLALELTAEEVDVMVADTLTDELTEVLVRDTEELEEMLAETLVDVTDTPVDDLTEVLVDFDDFDDLTLVVVVLWVVLEAVVQFEMSLAPSTLDAEIARPMELFK